MTHSYAKLCYHLVWSTKNREKFIHNEIKNRLYGYIRAVINDNKQQLYVINGMADHIHLLVGLSPTHNVSEFIQMVKICSTKWLKSKPLYIDTFSWQEGYGAYSVGYSTMKSTIKYIENQEEHHKTITFEDEYKNFLELQGIDYDPRFVLG